MFTGRYAGNHGVIGMVGMKLNRDIPTMAGIFTSNGYETYAEATGPLHPILAIDRGFANYNYRSQHDYYFTDWGKNLLSRFQNGQFKSPYFVLIHFWEVHVPRQVPPEFSDPQYGLTDYDRSLSALDSYLGQILQYAGDDTLVILTGDHGEAVGDLPGSKTLLPYYLRKLKLPATGAPVPRSVENVSDLVAEEPRLHQFISEIGRLSQKNISRIDFWHRVKLIFDLFKIGCSRYRIQLQKGIKGGFFSDINQKINDTRLLLMVGRGKVEAAQLQLVRSSLKEHTLQHGYHIYDYLQCVPAVFFWNGIIDGGLRIDTDLRHIDLLPTLIELLHLEAPLSGMDGESYLSHLNNRGGENRPIFLEARGGAQAEQFFLIRGLRRENYKIAFAPHEMKAPVEFYDLSQDPQERNNLASSLGKKAKEFRREAEALATSFKSTADSRITEEEAEKMVEKLKNLGYL